MGATHPPTTTRTSCWLFAFGDVMSRKKIYPEERVITQEVLHKVFKYDPETGVLYNRIDRSSTAKKGEVAGSLVKTTGYWQLHFFGKVIAMHRIVWLYHHGKWPNYEIDHIDGNPLNNRIENLRDVVKRQNKLNSGKGVNNSSGCVGVSWNKKHEKWEAYIYSNYKKIKLGYFTDKQDAVKARKEANIKYGFHELHGTRNSYATEYRREVNKRSRQRKKAALIGEEIPRLKPGRKLDREKLQKGHLAAIPIEQEMN